MQKISTVRTSGKTILEGHWFGSGRPLQGVLRFE